MRRPWIAALEPPFLDVHAARWVPGDAIELRDDARRFESWEHSVANRLGLGAAVDYALALGVDAIAARVVALAASLREQLVGVRGLRLHDLGVERCGIVTFTIDGVDAYELAARLACGAASTSRCRRSTSPATTSRRAGSTRSRARRCTTTTPRTSSTALVAALRAA